MGFFVRDFHLGKFEVKVQHKRTGKFLCLARDNILTRAETKARWILMDHLVIIHGHQEPWRIDKEYEFLYGETDSSRREKFTPTDCFFGLNYVVKVVVK